MGLFLVERYLPGVTPEELASITARLRLAVADRGETEEHLRYLGSTFVPDEESCFCRFEAESVGVVAAVCASARFPYARITEAHAYPEAKEDECES